MNELRDLIGYPHFWGSKPPQNPEPGDFYVESNTHNMYICVKNCFELLGGNAELQTNNYAHRVVKTICECCGASLPIKNRTSRIVKCSYCGMEWDVES